MANACKLDLELIHAYLDDSCTEEQAAELLRRLREDMGVARELAFQAKVQSLLESIGREQAAEEVEKSGAIFRSVGEPSISRLPESGRGVGVLRPWRVVLPLAAAVALAAAGLWWGITNAGRGMRNAERRMGGAEQGAAVGRVAEVRGGVWGYRGVGVMGRDGDGEKRRLDLKVGDGVREGMRIETGDRGRVQLAFEGGPASPGWLRRGEAKAEVAVMGGSTFNIQRSTSNGEKIVHLERGKLAATVARQKPGMGFVFLTPQARMEVKGTRFVFGVDAVSTRLEVLNGLVGMMRLSDGKSVDVAAGQYAVAAEGVDLVALALPDSARRAAEQAFARPAPKPSRYGNVLFDDEFDGVLANWDVLVGGPGSEAQVLVDPLPHAKMEKNLSHVQSPPQPVTSTIVLESCVVLDSENAPGGFVAIRSKKPIKAERFVVELGCVFSPTGHKGSTSVEFAGIEALEKNMTDTGERTQPASIEYGPIYTVHRWEFRSGADGKLHCRMYRGGNWKSDASLGGMFKSCLIRPESTRMMFDVRGSGWRMLVDRVRVREILDDDVAESIQR